MSKPIRFRHFVNSGDLISIMAGIQHVYEVTGREAIIQQRIGMPGFYYQNAVHPLVDANGVQVTMTQKQWEMLVPLLMSQDYVQSCEVWEGQEFDIDLNRFRDGHFTTMPMGQIQRWSWYVFPDMACDLSKPWLNIPKVGGYEDKAVINFTQRYRNYQLTYYFLKKYEANLLFAGTEFEHNLFMEENKLDIPRLDVTNFYELAVIINSAKFFLGNQSFCYNLAEAMKTPRAVEVCVQASNCVPVGEHAYDYIHQQSLEYYVEKLFSL